MVCLFVCLSLCFFFSVRLSVPLCPSVRLSVSMSVCLSLSMSVCLPVRVCCLCRADVPLEDTRGDQWKLPTKGYTVCPYLPPVPPSGTGLHRFIFTLYTHSRPLNLDHTQVGEATESWLRHRAFSSARFLADADAENQVQPYSFCYFQTHWDSSVRHTYKHILSKGMQGRVGF